MKKYIRLACFLAVWIAAWAASAQCGETQATRSDFPALPEKIASFGAAINGDWIYVFGGHIGKTHEHSAKNVTSAFRRISLNGTGGWEGLPGGIGMQGSAFVADGKYVYRIGGLIPKNEPEAPDDLRSTAEAARFDPASKKWDLLPPLPVVLSSHDAAWMDGWIYVMGGWSLKGRSSSGVWNAKAWRLNTSAANPAWEEIAAPPFKRRALAVVAAPDGIHAIGGMDTNEKISSQHDVYDPAKGEWRRGPDLPEDGFGFAACTSGDSIFGSAMPGKVYQFSKDAWEQRGTLATPRYFHRLLPLGDGRLLAAAGAGKQDHLDNLEVIDAKQKATSTEASKAKVSVREIDFPGHALNRQGIFNRGNELIVFGGNNSAEQHDFEPKNFVGEVWRMDLANGLVSPMPPMLMPRQSIQTIIMPGDPNIGVALGGFGHDGRRARSHDELLALDFTSGKWQPIAAKLPKPLTQFGLVQRQGEVWLFGGMDFDPDRGAEGEFKIQNSVLRWKPSEKGSAWETTDFTLPRPRRAFGCAVLDDKVYLIGGMKEEFDPVRVSDVFDLKTGTWNEAPVPEKSLISPEAAVLNGRLYLACGSTVNEAGDFLANRSVVSLDPKTGTWSTIVSDIPEVLRHTRLFVQDGKLLMYAINATKNGNKIRLITIEPPSSI